MIAPWLPFTVLGLWALSLALYVLYIRKGVWRRVFWESLALAFLSILAAGWYGFLAPGTGSILLIALSVVWTLSFLIYTRVVLRNPAGLRLRPGDILDLDGLLDEEGRSPDYPDLSGPSGLYLLVYRGHW